MKNFKTFLTGPFLSRLRRLRLSTRKRNLLLIFITTFVAVSLYLNFAQHVRTANQEKKLQETRQTLEEAQSQHEKSKEVIQQKNKKVKKLQNKVRELEKKLQAKRAAQRVYARKVAPVALTGNCASWMRQAGIPSTNATRILIQKESGCNPYAVNPTSGACGIPQALPCNMTKFQTYLSYDKARQFRSNPVYQLEWMKNYVAARYGSWNNALAFHRIHNWY